MVTRSQTIGKKNRQGVKVPGKQGDKESSLGASGDGDVVEGEEKQSKFNWEAYLWAAAELSGRRGAGKGRGEVVGRSRRSKECVRWG